jgi:hypothetical protein
VKLNISVCVDEIKPPIKRKKFSLLHERNRYWAHISGNFHKKANRMIINVKVEFIIKSIKRNKAHFIMIKQSTINICHLLPKTQHENSFLIYFYF